MVGELHGWIFLLTSVSNAVAALLLWSITVTLIITLSTIVFVGAGSQRYGGITRPRPRTVPGTRLIATARVMRWLTDPTRGFPVIRGKFWIDLYQRDCVYFIKQEQNSYPWLIRLFGFYNLSYCDLTSLFDQKLIVSFPGKRGNVGKESATCWSSASIKGGDIDLVLRHNQGDPEQGFLCPFLFWDTLQTCIK